MKIATTWLDRRERKRERDRDRERDMKRDKLKGREIL